MKLIEFLKNLNYLRTPCKECLVNPICKDKCDKLETHYELYHFIHNHLSGIILSIEITLIAVIIISLQYFI